MLSIFIFSVLLMSQFQQQVQGLKCAQCSYFPKDLDALLNLKDDALAKSNISVNVTEADKRIIESFRAALSTPSPGTQIQTDQVGGCIETPTTVTCKKGLNTCVRQLIYAKDPQIKLPAVVYSCSSWTESGEISKKDSLSIWTMYGCTDENKCATLTLDQLKKKPPFS